jgi:hypothetical protein
MYMLHQATVADVTLYTHEHVAQSLKNRLGINRSYTSVQVLDKAHTSHHITQDIEIVGPYV